MTNRSRLAVILAMILLLGLGLLISGTASASEDDESLVI